MQWRRKDLLGLEPLEREEIELILDTAESTREVFGREIKKFPTLRGRTVVNLFYEPSTRTRSSFELAGKWMSADVINISPSGSSVQKGESLLDTVRTLTALGADAVVMRHSQAGAAEFVARHTRAAVINAGDGAHEHPTQALLDLFTLRRRRGSLDRLKVLIVGDIAHSRVARSNLWGMSKFGAEVTLCGPPTLLPPGIEGFVPGVRVTTDLDDALPGAEVVMVLRLQRERQQKGLLPSLAEYSREYGLNRERLRRCPPDVIVMHPGPANLGVEISEEVASDPRSVISDQVTNGVAVRMALLYLLLGRDTDGTAA
ncbi:MAG: aspartate carbamoyltransferase catalytic subunit [Bacillota bacterium]|nr:aspartate carbamoyltransferase catalytic subunit [Bacillota bacterium]